MKQCYSRIHFLYKSLVCFCWNIHPVCREPQPCQLFGQNSVKVFCLLSFPLLPPNFYISLHCCFSWYILSMFSQQLLFQNF